MGHFVKRLNNHFLGGRIETDMDFKHYPGENDNKTLFPSFSPLSGEIQLVGDGRRDDLTDSGFHRYMMNAAANGNVKAERPEVNPEDLYFRVDNGDEPQQSFGIFGLHIPRKSDGANRMEDDPSKRSAHVKSRDKKHNGRKSTGTV